jgi:Uncharacterised nucleotidyltransferase
MDARHLAKALAEPDYVLGLDGRAWNALIAMARAERLEGALAQRVQGLAIPPRMAALLGRATLDAEADRLRALWEAKMAARALAPLGIKPILLKGTAYAAAGLDAARGRLIGDLDILVPRERINAVEAALLDAGWERIKSDPYDQAYYREHMHELPPLIHAERDRIIDVHHTILPLTARPMPDAAALIADAEDLGEVMVLSPEDRVIHAVAHLFADGDLAGGLRNLWDIDRLLREASEAEGFWPRLITRAQLHQLPKSLSRALRLAHHVFGTPVDVRFAWKGRRGDVYYVGRLLARDSWGRETRWLLRQGFYVRSHWLRMPPLMLARHLFKKWRMGLTQET